MRDIFDNGEARCLCPLLPAEGGEKVRMRDQGALQPQIEENRSALTLTLSRRRERERAQIAYYAACFFGVISLRLIMASAICTAFSAAPLRRLSDTHQKAMPFSTVASSRMREI